MITITDLSSAEQSMQIFSLYEQHHNQYIHSLMCCSSMNLYCFPMTPCQQAQLPHSRYRRSAWVGRKHAAIFSSCLGNLKQDAGRLLPSSLHCTFCCSLPACLLHPASALPSLLFLSSFVSLFLRPFCPRDLEIFIAHHPRFAQYKRFLSTSASTFVVDRA
jgi:hypothetical protein